MEAIGCNVEEALIVGEAGSTAERNTAQNIREHLRVTLTGIANIVMNIVF